MSTGKERESNYIYIYMMETKICKVCSDIKDVSKFRKRPSGKYSPTCKRCYRDKWYLNNPDYQKNYDRKRWLYNKDSEKERNSKWRSEKYKNWMKNKMETDYLFCTKIKIRWCIRSTFKKNGYTKKSKTYDILGIGYDEFKSYIEGMFKEGMSWSNHGS